MGKPRSPSIPVLIDLPLVSKHQAIEVLYTYVTLTTYVPLSLNLINIIKSHHNVDKEKPTLMSKRLIHTK